MFHKVRNPIEFRLAVNLLTLNEAQTTIRAISSFPSSSANGTRSLLLQIHRTPLIPFGHARTVKVPACDVTLSSRLFHDNIEQINSARKRIDEREFRLHAFATTNLLTLPMRQTQYWMWRGFLGVKRAFTDENFLYLHIKGYNSKWRLDSDPEFALNDGKALDKLVAVKIA